MRKRSARNGTLSGALVTLSILSISLMMLSCQTRIIATENPLCHTDMAIDFSASMDTPETVSQIRRHNAAWESVCNGSR